MVPGARPLTVETFGAAAVAVGATGAAPSCDRTAPPGLSEVCRFMYAVDGFESREISVATPAVSPDVTQRLMLTFPVSGETLLVPRSVGIVTGLATPAAPLWMWSPVKFVVPGKRASTSKFTVPAATDPSALRMV